MFLNNGFFQHIKGSYKKRICGRPFGVALFQKIAAHVPGKGMPPVFQLSAEVSC